MTAITADALRQEIAGLEAQRRQAADLVQQATGALALARAMLARIEDGPTLDELAEAVAGPGATAEIVPNGRA